jgi:hypothetical protein
MFERWFRSGKQHDGARSASPARYVFTMAYIIVVQPAVLSGQMFV